LSWILSLFIIFGFFGGDEFRDTVSEPYFLKVGFGTFPWKLWLRGNFWVSPF